MSKGIGKSQQYLLITLHEKGGATTADVLSDCFFEDERYSRAWDSDSEREYRKERLRTTRRAMAALEKRGLVQNTGKSEIGPLLFDSYGKRMYRREKTIWALTDTGAILASECAAKSHAEFVAAEAERKNNMTPQQLAEYDAKQAIFRESIKRLKAQLA
jgi:hypothetical protein